eukprot:gene40502-28132_t
MRDFLSRRQPAWSTDDDHMRVEVHCAAYVNPLRAPLPQSPPLARMLVNEEASRRNIVDGMKWLVWGAAPGDSLFFFFAGHGSQTPDLDGRRRDDDGLDETILPVDFRDPRGGQILDDTIGTGMDLPYGLVTTAKDWKAYQNGETPEHQSLQPLSELEVRCRGSNGDVLLISGCCDDQTSSDSSDIQAEFQGQFPTLFNCGRPPQLSEEEEEREREWRRQQQEEDMGDWLGGVFGSDKKKDDDDEGTSRKERKQYTGGGAGPPGVIVGRVGADGRRMPAKSGGALTTAFTVLMNKWETEGVTYDKLLYGIREVLEKCNFDQKPQLSGSRPFMISCPVEI